MEFKKVLDDIMVRLNHQFTVPAQYTIKDQGNDNVDVHIFIHGWSVSHFSTLEFLLEVVKENSEHIRMVNGISDYLIGYFIQAMKEEEEVEAISEVKENLEYVYEQNVEAIRWLDEKTNDWKVSFIPYKPEMVITLTAEQLKREYEERFNSEDAPDILVDISKINQIFAQEGFTSALEFAQKLQRNIQVSKFEDNETLQKVLFN